MNILSKDTIDGIREAMDEIIKEKEGVGMTRRRSPGVKPGYVLSRNQLIRRTVCLRPCVNAYAVKYCGSYPSGGKSTTAVAATSVATSEVAVAYSGVRIAVTSPADRWSLVLLLGTSDEKQRATMASMVTLEKNTTTATKL